MSAEVRRLNDQLRSTFQGGKVVITAAVHALPETTIAKALQAVREFEGFTPDNDPHEEHDFGSFEEEAHKFFFKIDYYNKDMTGGSEDPENPEVTTRVLTIMLQSDY